MNNQFSPDKFRDHTIVTAVGEVVGHIRVKTSGVLWAPKNAKVWYGVSLEKFAELMEGNGKKQKK